MTLEEQALALYRAYPRKVARKAAVRAIKKALLEEPFEVLLDAVEEYAEARKGQDSQFTPHPSTWFNQGRWDDDREEWWQGRKPEVNSEVAFDKVRQAISKFGRAKPVEAREWLRDEAIVHAVKEIGWSRLCDMDDYSRTSVFNRFRVIYEESAINAKRSRKGEGREGTDSGREARETIPFEAARRKAE